MILGIDVSACQSIIDWQALADGSEIRFAICKITEGAAGVDPDRLRNLEGARSVGIVDGVYHFAHVSEDPATQAQRLWDLSGTIFPLLPAVIDLESAPSAWTGAQIVAAAEALAREIRDRFGRWPLLYSYPAFLIKLGPALASSRILANCRLWITHYRWNKEGAPPVTIQPMVTLPWSKWTIWQYSGNDGAHLPGIRTAVDRNVFAGDEAAFRELQGLPDAPETEREIGIIHPGVPLERDIDTD